MNYILDYFKELLQLFEEMSPYLLLGFLFAGILHSYFPHAKINKYMGKRNFMSVFNAAMLGVPLPLCSCGVIPTGVAFHKNGASKGASVAFLISTPQTGVDSILATYSLLGLPFAILRPLVALITGIFGGLLTNLGDKTQEIHQEVVVETEKKPVDKFKDMFRYAFVEFLQDISKWLIVGLLIATLISVVLPNDFFTRYIGNDLLTMLLIVLIAVPMYVCATGSIPIALVLLTKGVSPGAVLVFLMAGPATNAATITVLAKVLGRKTLLFYVASITFGALFFGFLTDYFLPREWFVQKAIGHYQALCHEGQTTNWFGLISTVVLIGLIINGYFQRNRKTNIEIVSTETCKTILVDGMTCNHCKANVENNLATLDGIKNVEVDLATSKVNLYGEYIDIQKVKDTLDEIGYEFKGEV